MSFLGDFHIHGCYAQACSKNTTIERLEENARTKGLHILGTGDCLHPKWYQHLTSTLTEDEHGILRTKTNFPFLWQTEVSLMYTHGGKGRRVHHVLLFPNKEAVEQARDVILKRWRLDYDGRPIFGCSSIEFLDLMRSVSPNIEMIPAHAWTAFFSIFGSKSGYNSIQECFEERAQYIHAIETGMSSDPAMNRRLSQLDNINLVSFSDPHTYFPWRLGREATRFDCDLTYKGILHALRTGEGLKGTIETPPVYGKYHIDGHRACDVHFEYEETKQHRGICPKCKHDLTLGVAYRVEELADRKEPQNVPSFVSVVPLHELIAAVYDIKQLASKKVWEIYRTLIKTFGNEFTVLLDASEDALAKVVDPKLARVILLNREQKLPIEPGYDGVYGKVVLNNQQILAKQKSLGEYT
ncbi:MAG: endonuclease Q family protein [Nanoarchaeota archaeon]